MIHDKDYIIRIVKQFSEFLSKMILGGKNEDDLIELQRVFDTNMNDTFKMDFETLAAKPTEEIVQLINDKESGHQIPYFELLGHLFYFKNKENPNADLAEKAKTFYEQYLQKSGIFSLPIVSRIGELNKV
ncbi:hypothetical protein [Kaistella jeonii]|uniref:Uncharacterized protein n=1 Tax=Kaistella jeonii TaxID=266749 RepID=A0A0C1FAG5_9FLAO|nr:hypothetical protein [Kaistella jeonii]KIA90102.1 hypothetical protein OA86_05805 [Kaistella jeonii]SFB77766.1 hypothetical protein SAMN05421876_102129 [Kaistella jeonii]VEI96379.1 Uncharacterised protein [Kaistella jeonii]